MKILARFHRVALPIVVGLTLGSARGEPHASGAVTIQCTCDDEIGRSYKAALLTALTQSGLSWSAGDGRSDGAAALNVSIISRRLASTASGNPRSAVSVAYDGNGTRVEQEIESCDQLPLQESIQAALDEFRPLLKNTEPRPSAPRRIP